MRGTFQAPQLPIQMDEVKEEKQTSRAPVSATFGAIATVVAIKVSFLEMTSKENMKNRQVSIAMLFISGILSVVTTQLETLVRQPLVAVFRLLNTASFIFLAIAFLIIVFFS